MPHTPIDPGIGEPTPGIIPSVPDRPKPRPDPDDGKVILNPDGTLHLGTDGSAMIHDRTADPCCEEQEGVCCLPNGDCVDDIARSECLAQGGEWHRDVTCADDPCAKGPCCLPGLACEDDLTLAECEARGGFWLPGWIGYTPEQRCEDVGHFCDSEFCGLCRAETTPRAWIVTLSGVQGDCSCVDFGTRSSQSWTHNINGTYLVPNSGCSGSTGSFRVGTSFTYADDPSCDVLTATSELRTNVGVRFDVSGVNRVRIIVDAVGGGRAFFGAVLLPGRLPVDVDCIRSVVINNSRVYKCSSFPDAGWQPGDGTATVEPIL